MTQVGQFTVPSLAGVQTAAAQIATSTQTDAQAAGVVPSMRQATIVSLNGGTPPTCTVTFDGITNVAGIRYMWPYTPVVGDVVNCIVQNGVTWIAGQLTTNVDTAPRGPIGTAVNGYTTQRGIAYHDGIITAAAGPVELNSDFRITVPACPTRLIELKYTGMVQYTGSATFGSAIVITLWSYSGGLATQYAQSNMTGISGDFGPIFVRRRMPGPNSTTTFTVAMACAGGNLGQVLSTSAYPGLFTIDDVGGV